MAEGLMIQAGMRQHFTNQTRTKPRREEMGLKIKFDRQGLQPRQVARLVARL